ncbi:MAG: hypothetical protein J6I69_02440 [Bacilli bacterium]|nr:hypothetical protein [Bacilli bacterium]
MSNPFNSLNPMNQMNMGAIQNAYQMLMNAQNPMQLFMRMAQQNPQLQPVANMLRNGANPQALFNQMCQQRGINSQQFLNTITKQNK